MLISLEEKDLRKLIKRAVLGVLSELVVVAGRGGSIAILHYSQKPLYYGVLKPLCSFFVELYHKKCWTNVGHFFMILGLFQSNINF